MCGIFAFFGYTYAPSEADTRGLAHNVSKLQRHRGPDWSGVEVVGSGCALAHERLAIIGVSSGVQPIKSRDSGGILSVNGEIYNYRQLRAELQPKHDFSTESDCEVIMHLYEDVGEELFDRISGIFAFVLYVDGEYLVARDPIGVNSLYQGWHKDGSRWFASEMKCLVPYCERIEVFPPGHYYSSAKKACVQYYRPAWISRGYLPTTRCDLQALREAFEKAVEAQTMSQVPYGTLLSGGLDSSLVTSVVSRIVKKRGQKLKTFSIGLKDSSDLKFAARVAEFLGTEHYEFTFTIQEGLDTVPDIIYHLETYDVTTIRASIPMFLLARHIKALGVKMVLSGEGSDEVFGGYLYFHSAPDATSFHEECVSRVKNLHLADCLRANKSTMAWGLETRVPFLAKEFLDVAMEIRPEEKMPSNGGIEKYVLRKAFDSSSDPYLPDDILWRQKEQFSDGVGYSWIDELRAMCDRCVSDQRMANAGSIFHFDPPTNKEQFHYREVFQTLFPGTAAASTVQRWVPRTDWGCDTDPSGRAQRVHVAAY